MTDEEFLRGLGLWTLGFYVSLGITASYLSACFTRCNHGLHNDALRAIAMTKNVFFDKNPAGRMINRFSKDMSNCDGVLNYYLFDCLSYTGFLWGSIVAQIIIIPYATIVIPFYILIQVLMFYYLSKIISKLRKKEYLSKSPIFSLINIALEGLTTIRSQNLQNKILQELMIHIEHNFSCFITNQSYMRFTQLYSEFFGLIIVIINVTIIMKSSNLIEISLAAYSLSSSINIISTSSIATKDLLELSSLMFSPQHLLEYSSLEQENLNPVSNLKINSGKIVFQNISLRYQPKFPIILNNLTLTINPGERIGIVGRTGSGKSSILNVLCRITEPSSGTVYLDDQDYKLFGLHELRKQISVIPQSSVLFSTSLRDNIDPVRIFNDDEIWRVLKMVNLFDAFRNEGLDSELGIEGVQLSAGQRQLVCVARAVLGKNKIIVMDEATSNVDMKTDETLQRIIRKEFDGSTFVVIAHRILTALDSDRIVVVDGGRCVGFDRPLQLFDENGYFYRLAVSAGLERKHFLEKVED